MEPFRFEVTDERIIKKSENIPMCNNIDELARHYAK
jgi:hypothetical protein